MINSNNKIKVSLKEIVFSREEGKSFCDIFVYEPENIEEQALGNLYIIGEVVNFSENSSYLVNLLASIAKKEFYSNSKKSTIESLEASLHKVNLMLSDLAEQGNVDWIGNLNMTCGTYKNGELHLSQAGKIKTMLVRDGQITDIGKNITNEEKPHPFKTFTNIASGELENGDLVLFITPELFNVFSIEKLRQLASSLDIEELAEIIQDSVEKESDIKTIGLLLMKVEKDGEEKLPHIEIKPQIEEVTETEIITTITQEELKERLEVVEEEIIQPLETTKPEPKELKHEEKLSLEDIINKYEKEEIEKENFSNETAEKEHYTEKIPMSSEEKIEIIAKKEKTNDLLNSLDEKSDSKSLNKFLLKAKKTALSLGSVALSSALSLMKKIIKATGNIKLKKSEPGDEFPQQTDSSSNRKKIILVAFIFIAFILAGGLIFKNYKDSENEKFENYSNRLIQAEEKISRAEIDSISDPSEARKSLIEAKNILSARNTSLDNKKNYENSFNKISVLLEEIQKQLDIIDFVNRIESPAMAIDFNQMENINNPKKIFENGKNYYVFDSENNLLSGIDFDKNSLSDFKIETAKNTNICKLSTSMEKTGEIMFLTDSNKIGIFDVSEKTFSATDLAFSKNILDIKDVDSYSNFIYLLDPSSNQIYKYKRLTNSFDEGQNWLEEEDAHIENAVSMAIDGSIYLLNSDGSINKFRTGNEVTEFSTESPSDPISASAKLYTKPEFKYLYTIDSDRNRVVLFDKITGKLIRQYISNEFNDLKNIIVDEKEEKIYILNGDKIFEVEIGK